MDNFHEKKINRLKSLMSLLFLLIVLLLSNKLVKELPKKLPSLEKNPDLLLDALPFFDFSLLADIVVFLSVIGFIFYIFRDSKEQIPYYSVVIGIFYIVRDFFIYITPLANPYPSIGDWGAGALPEGGMFPSGHVGILTLFFLFTEGKAKYLFLTLLIVEIIAMLFAHGHYSLDLFGALFVSYAIYKFSEKYFKEKLKI